MITRRRYLALTLAAVLGWPCSVLTQPQAKLPRVVYIYVGTPESVKGPVDAFLQGMKTHGYENGRNVQLEDRHTDRIDRLPHLISDVIASKPAVVVVGGSQTVQAAKRATSTVPIVISTVGDPVGQGGR